METTTTRSSETMERRVELVDVRAAGQRLQSVCHGAAKKAGWWHDIHTGELLTNQPNFIPAKLLKIVSEIIEGAEGHCRDLMDDHLPRRKMLEVELADAIIRCFDLGGGLGFDLGSTILEKMEYNINRQDHNVENRKLTGGKSY